MFSYSGKAQPFLDAIANGVFGSQQIRDWLVQGTPAENLFRGSIAVEEEARLIRGRTTQPFWANHFCGRDRRCSCRLEGSKSLESDAIFFLRNANNRVLAIHIEFKHPGEAFQFGQPEGYPLRAACFARTHGERRTVYPHTDWMTGLFCGGESLTDPRLAHFQRVIPHDEARSVIPGYPSR